MFDECNHNEQAVRKRQEYKETVSHGILDVYVDGDTEFRQEVRKAVRSLYETSVSQACTAELSRIHDASANSDFLKQMNELEKTLRSFYVFKYAVRRLFEACVCLVSIFF
jgi:ribosome biogenesis protein Nip4